MTEFTYKDPSEQIPYGFDFAALVGANETIVSASAAMRVLQGADPAPGAMLSGAPIISGSAVTNKIIGGIDGTLYLFAITAITNTGNTWVESGRIRVSERD